MLLGRVGPGIIVSVGVIGVSSSNEVPILGWFISSVWVPIVVWAHRDLGVRVLSVKAPVRSRPQTVHADST